jgi:hypothetical protein
MKRDMELWQSAQIKAKAEKANEITILATPCLELGHGEQLPSKSVCIGDTLG